MKNENAALNRCLDFLFSHQSNGFGKVVITYRWGFAGHNVGPGITFYDASFEPMEHGGMVGFSEMGSFGKAFRNFLSDDPELLASRKVLPDGFLANRLEMAVLLDRSVEMKWFFDAEMDRVSFENAMQYMTPEEISEAEVELAEYMQHKGRSRRIRRDLAKIQEETPAPAPAPAPELQPWSIPELFQAIVSSTTGAAPDGWRKVVVDGEVWVEPDASGRALNNVSADFQALMADGSVRQIHPQQPMAAMNALTLLQKQLHNDEGKPWRRLRIEFDSAAPEKVDYEFDQAGLWRPER